MDKGKRRVIEGWIDKAGNQLQAARYHLKSYVQFSECIEACQECIELSVKSILSFLDIEYPSSHGWEKEQFSKIAKQIQDSGLVDRLVEQNLGHIRLPRLLFLANFWAQFYLPAKYGFQTGYLAPAQALFDREEAILAMQHAEECYNAALQMRHTSEDTLCTLAGHKG
jgi:HEPN domain-containing protein